MLVPKLRFKEFSDEWKKDKFGNLFNISAGGDISRDNISNFKNNIFKYPIYSNTLLNNGLYG